MEKLEPLDERHPADICFVPEVDDRDPGYLFVTDPGPNRLFVDRVGRQYDLAMASYHWDGARC